MRSSGAQRLIYYLRALPGFELLDSVRGSGWGGHLGGIVCDAALQANRNYTSTVEPRIAWFVSEHPECATVSGFLGTLPEADPAVTLAPMLDWNGRVRPQRAVDLALQLQAMEVEHATDLLALASKGRGTTLAQLKQVRGVGPKTSNYVLGLVGDPAAVAVDVRLRDVVRSAGVEVANDAEISELITLAARMLNVTPWTLDGAIWKASKNDRAAARPCGPDGADQ